MQNRSDSCDFCFYAEPPYWSLPATDFEMAPGHTSHGGWLACGTCLDLIEREDLTGLAKHVAKGYIGRGGSWRPEEARHLTALWRKFLDHSYGEPKLLEELRAECEHPEAERHVSGRNDRHTGQPYMVVACGLCGQEFPDLVLPPGEDVVMEGKHREGNGR